MPLFRSLRAHQGLATFAIKPGVGDTVVVGSRRESTADVLGCGEEEDGPGQCSEADVDGNVWQASRCTSISPLLKIVFAH